MKTTPYIIKATLIAFCFSFFATNAPAQTAAEYAKAADKFFAEGDYYSAAQYYEKFLTGKPGNKKNEFSPYVVQNVVKLTPAKASGRKDVVYNLAECYRNLHYYSKAQPYYQEAVDMGGIYPLAPYWLAKSLRANAKLDSAEIGFTDFISSYKIEDDYLKDAQKELSNLQFVKMQTSRKDIDRYVVNAAGAGMNETGASYAPFYKVDATVLFTSTRTDTGVATAKKSPNKNKLFEATYTAGNPASPQKILIPTDEKWEQGVASITPDGNKLFITRWRTENQKKITAIYSSTKSETGWSNPTPLADNINTVGFNARDPFVTTDGKFLLFSSDRAEGSGKFDIWYISLDASFSPAGLATNMGNTINTSGDDVAPFYHTPSKTMVLASNGRVGMGGFDLYYANGDFNTWQTPANMGYPVNSIKDDQYYATNDAKTIWNNALLSSDRNSPCCLELFSFDRKKLKKLISGLVTDCDGGKPLAGVNVSITNAQGKSIATKTTNSRGLYSILVDEFESLKAAATNDGYNPATTGFDAPADAEADSASIATICLTKPPVVEIEVDKPVVLENVLYDFNKAVLKPEAYPALDSLVALMQRNPGMAIELSSHTDNLGDEKYNQILSERRAQACVNYLVQKGILAERITSKGYGESLPIAPNNLENGRDNPAGREKNRRTEFKILHY